MKGRPLLSSQLQFYTLHMFKKFYLENGKQMSTKVYETILLNYLFMVLTMKQTAHGLVPEDIAATFFHNSLGVYFITHLENIS